MADDEEPVKGWKWISWILFAMIAILLIYVIIIIIPSGKLPAEIVLGVELVIGVIALIVSLVFMTVIFKSLNLTNPENSLGLPEGSIRAVIALSLILIFMISSVFLYYQVGHPATYTSVNVTEAQIANISQGTIVSIQRGGTYNNESVFNVTFLANNQSSVDIAKQIITTVSTLVVAIAGFYFGTKAVSVAKGAVEISSPVIRRVEPLELKVGDNEKEIKIIGKDFETPKVKFKPDSGIEFIDMKWNETEISCKVNIKDDAAAGKYTVIVTNSDGGEDRLEDAFEVKGK
jgi:hypothetical protein